MTSHLVALCVDANDPLRLALFWAGVLGWELADDPHDIALVPSDDTGQGEVGRVVMADPDGNEFWVLTPR